MVDISTFPQPLATLIGAALALIGGFALKWWDEKRARHGTRTQICRLLTLVRAAIAPFTERSTAREAEFPDKWIVERLWERTFSSDAALALNERESRLLYNALAHLKQSLSEIDELRRAEQNPETAVRAVILNWHKIPRAADDVVEQLDRVIQALS